MDLFNRAGAILRAWRMRLGSRQDSEHEQAFLRLVIGSLLTSYALWLGLADDGTLSLTETHAVEVGIVFCGAALLLIAHIFYRPETHVVRRAIGAVIDTVTVSYGMLILNESGVLFFSVYLWVILGNGFRYGVPYLLLSTCLSLIGFGFVITASAYWHQHLPFAVGLLIMLVVIPLYASTLIRKLNKALRRAEEASKAKSQFLARMSHELRTPLNGVTGMTHVLMQTPLTRDQREIAETVVASGRMLTELINNVLDFSKIEAGKTEVETVHFDLHALLNGLITVFLPQARQKNLDFRLHLSPDVPFAIQGDPLHLRQVLVNLASNAIKFTDAGYVEINVSPVARSSDSITIRFEVQDTGIGIPDEVQSKIFESFSQASPSTARIYGGTGLGTTIAQQLVRLMGGELSLRSQAGQGSVFWFDLSFALSSQVSLPDGTAGLTECRTMLVGVNPSLQAVLGALLPRWSVPYTVVENTSQALRQLIDASESGIPFRVVMVDGNNPGAFPIEFAAAARSESGLYGLTMTLFRHSGDVRSNSDYLSAGYTSVLNAPPDTRQLFNVLHAVVAREADVSPGTVVPLSERAARAAARKARALRILVAEDNPVNQNVTRSILESDGHEVVIAPDGEAALDALDQGDFDLVIADLRMPAMGGLEAMKIYDFSHTGRRVPWIILTADATRETLEECARSGADGYLTKPINPTMLLARVSQVAEVTRHADIIPIADAAYSNKPLIDVSVLFGVDADGMRPRADSAIERFQENALTCIERMQSGMLRKDHATIRIAARALESYCAEVGALRLAQQAARMTAKPGADLLRSAGDDMHELVNTYEESIQSLRTHARRRSPSS